jgi:excinuclease ABC subunit B
MLDYFNIPKLPKGAVGDGASASGPAADLDEKLSAMRLEMFEAAENLDFEKAARLRDDLKKLEAVAGRGGAPDGEGEAPVGFDPYPAGSKRTTSRTRATKSPEKSAASGGSRGGRKYNKSR